MTTKNPAIVSQKEWHAAHAAHLVLQKALTRQRDALRVARQALPWVKIDKPYIFHSTDGEQSLEDLFKDRSQLIIKHFMFGPGWC